MNRIVFITLGLLIGNIFLASASNSKDKVKKTFQKMNVEEQIEAIKNCKNPLEQVMLLSSMKAEPSQKSSQTGTQKLDSLIIESYDQTSATWKASTKQTFTYNTNNQETSNSYYRWIDSLQKFQISIQHEYTYNSNGNKVLYTIMEMNDSTQQLENVTKTETTYTEEGKKSGQISFMWNKTAQQWIGTYQSEYTFDGNGYYASMSYYIWDDSQQWTGTSKSVYTNDSNGNETHLDLYHWDSSIKDWAIFRKADYLYDSRGNETEMIYYYQSAEDTTSWVYHNRATFSYNENDQMTLYSIYNWDSDSLQWNENERHEYIYNNEGKENSHVYYTLNSTTNQMELVSKTDVTYDSSGNITLYENLSADSTGEFYVTEKEEFEYNPENDLISQSSYYYNLDVQKMVGYYKVEMEYNTDYSYNDLILPENYDESSFSHMLKKYTEYNNMESDTTEWTGSNSETFFYSAVHSEVNVNIINQKSFSLYPNPTKGQITLKLKEDHPATLEVYNLQGVKIETKAIEGNQSTLNLNIKNGTYLYRVIQDGESYSGRILIQ